MYNILESLRLRGPWPGFVGRIATNIQIYIYTDGGLIDFTSVGLAQARPNNNKYSTYIHTYGHVHTIYIQYNTMHIFCEVPRGNFHSTRHAVSRHTRLTIDCILIVKSV